MTLQCHMEELEDNITAKNTVVYPHVAHINSLLHNALLSCKAAMSTESSSDMVQLKGDSIAANKNWSISGVSRIQHREEERPSVLVGMIKNKAKYYILVMQTCE